MNKKTEKRILTIAIAIVLATLTALFIWYTYIPPVDETTLPEYTVKFESYNDQKISSQTVKQGKLLAKPEELKMDGHTFLGWFDGEKRWDFEKDTVGKDMTLTAKWKWHLAFAEAKDGSGGVWVTGCDYDVENVVIPKEYNGKKVTGIEWGFTARTKLKSVVIPDTVTYISANAFNRCNSLTTITIPKSVEKIGVNAFSKCENLKTIYCEAEKKPIQWYTDFNTTNAEVIYGKKEG